MFVIISAPKRASRIIWNPDLEDDSLNHHSPRHTPTKPRSVLRQVTTSILIDHIPIYSITLCAYDIGVLVSLTPIHLCLINTVYP